jgi:hypothetical protein
MVASPAKPEVGEGGLNECQAVAADRATSARARRAAAELRRYATERSTLLRDAQHGMMGCDSVVPAQGFEETFRVR